MSMNNDQRNECTDNIDTLLRGYADDGFTFTFGEYETRINNVERISGDRIVITLGDGRKYRIAIAGI